jgi:tRNA pseudouridine32 synthase / 23S rRNA pseudouridine746 synthase
MANPAFPATEDGGIAASRWQLPAGPWPTVLDGLCAHFPQIPRAVWVDRMERGRVFGPTGALMPASAYQVGLQLRYYREVIDEAPVAGTERIVHLDTHLLVADKPHGLPVTPAGRHLRETLLARLIRRTGNPDLVPLHRLDRETAGLVLFSPDPASRASYAALFRERRIAKRYEALAPALPDLQWPQIRRSRIQRGEPFFRMTEIDAAPNSETRIEVLDRSGPIWRYALHPLTGRKHQLRLHMAALGAPICGDRWYPTLRDPEENSDIPLQLLARALDFVDPLDGRQRSFESSLELSLGCESD